MFNPLVFNPLARAVGAGQHLPANVGITAGHGPGITPPRHLHWRSKRTRHPGCSHLRPSRAGFDAPRAANANIVSQFIDGLANAENELRVTSFAIKRCGMNFPAAEACLAELNRCGNQTGERVVPNVFCYDAVSSAHSKAGNPQGAVDWFDRVWQNGVVPDVAPTFPILMKLGNRWRPS